MNTSTDSDFEGFERDEPPELKDGSDSDSEDEYFYDWNSHIVRDELDGSSTDGDDDAMLPEPRNRTTFPGGRGTGRPNRAAPRPYIEDVFGKPVRRHHLAETSAETSSKSTEPGHHPQPQPMSVPQIRMGHGGCLSRPSRMRSYRTRHRGLLEVDGVGSVSPSTIVNVGGSA